MKKFVIVAGYGWSGSSALVDYLKEFDKAVVPNVEFRLIKDPYGIADLEDSLMSRWDYVNSAAAIEDFFWLAKRCSYKPRNYFSPQGLGYSELLTPSFLKITKEYLSSLTSFSYHNNNIHSIFKQSYISYLKKRILNTINRRTHGLLGKEDCGNVNHFSKPEYDFFIQKTREYVERIFDGFPDDKIIVLDQAVSPLHTETLKYFNNVKMIIVDRNPTDIYVDLVRCRRLIGKELSITHDPEVYVKWHNAIRPSSCCYDNVLNVGFEDLVLNYDVTTRRILEFIGWDLGKQSQFAFFNPDVSKKNIGFGVCDDCSEKEYNYIKDRIKVK